MEFEKQLEEWMKLDYVLPEDLPNIELYMDQVTTFLEEQLKNTKRFEEDKIFTKTMINNYTKNHLLPPSVKKKYSREHIFLLIMIYRLKNVLSITDIQSLLEPLTTEYFSAQGKDEITLKNIYDQLLTRVKQKDSQIEQTILHSWEKTRDSFSEHDLPAPQAEALDDFLFLYELCYDIYVRKQLIEKIIDHHREQHVSSDKKTKKKGTAL